jgi:hypothetical protein
MNPLQDDSGNNSSIRVILALSFILLIYQLIEFRYAFRLEVVKEEPDYNGLSILFGAMVLNFVFVLIMKVIQKKYEK